MVFSTTTIATTSGPVGPITSPALSTPPEPVQTASITPPNTVKFTHIGGPANQKEYLVPGYLLDKLGIRITIGL